MLVVDVQVMHNPVSMTNFPLDSEQCALLLDLESAGSVRVLAELRGRDISAVNRQLQKISDMAPVLEKSRDLRVA